MSRQRSTGQALGSSHAGRRAAFAAAAAIGALALLGLFAARARAGTYPVIQCSQLYNVQHEGAGYNTNPAAFSIDGDCTGGLFADEISIGTGGAASCCYQQAAVIWTAPYGAFFTHVAADVSFSASANWPQFYFEHTDTSGQVMIKNGDSGGLKQPVQGDAGGGRGRVVMRLICTSGNSCGNTGRAGISNIRFDLTDVTAPSVQSLSGSLFSGSWVSGAGQSAGAAAFDYGSGISDIFINANGTAIAHQGFACDTVGGGYLRTFSPCQGGTTKSASFDGLDVRRGPFHEGTNAIQACGWDLATSGSANIGCSSTTLRVDNIAPGSVSGTTLAGGQSWKPTNDFDLSWTNPSQPGDVAPLVATHYRVTGLGYDSGDQRIGLTNHLDNLTVPQVGEFAFQVWTEDGAGNKDASTAQTLQLRFDDTVPGGAEANFNGWINRNDFPYTVRWTRADATQLGPSGLKGYAVSIDREPNTDPCLADNQAGCSAAEITHGGGIDDTSEVLEDRPNGSGYYIHVATVTGAGIETNQVNATLLPVDKVDPTSRIDGVPEGWVNRDVALHVVATDSLSGMQPNPNQFSPDPQPETSISVDGSTVRAPAESVATTISTEGVHQVRFWARDLAGNVNDGAGANNSPGSATVRIDKTPPIVGFENSERPEEPSLIEASAQDALSGVAEGVIAIRRADGGAWRDLDTEVNGSRLAAVVPDEMPDGDYLLRASATDRAANTTTSSVRADGSPMRVTLPLKVVTEIAGGIGRRHSKRARLAYGRPSAVAGVLRTAAGRPLPNQELTIVESFGSGARTPRAERTVTTASDGGFRLTLSAGPTRIVSVSYRGTKRYYGSRLDELKLRVRAKLLAFTAPRSVSEDEAIAFSGRVGRLGVKLGKLGKLILIQYLKAPGIWKTIDTTRTDSRGRFKLRYALRADYAEPATVVFRAVVPKERRWPYAGSARSRQRRVTIVPN